MNTLNKLIASFAATVLATFAIPAHAQSRPNKPYDDPPTRTEPETKLGEEIEVGKYGLPPEDNGYCARIPKDASWYRAPQENYDSDTRFAYVACHRKNGKADCMVHSMYYFCTLQDCTTRYNLGAVVQNTGTEWFCASNSFGRWFRAE